ncbi:MAG: hypothetical protein IIU58_04965 [Clostridia bacterium]|nr:hypothetical protein [Clostridia bacterium]
MEKHFEDIQITKEFYTDADGINLDSMYSQCNAELALQQSKRDQIIALYITVAGFLIPTVMNLNIGAFSTASAFTLMFFVGIMLCRVIVRYRVYKEVYWITSRTIAELFRIPNAAITKELVQKIFADNLRKDRASVLIVYPFAEECVSSYLVEGEKQTVDFKKAVNKRASRKRMCNSAETYLYMLMALMSAATLFLAVFSLASACLPDHALLSAAISLAGGAAAFEYAMQIYIRSLSDLFRYCFDKEKSSFNAAYAKAWFLHGFRY